MRQIHPTSIHEKFVASGRYYHNANAITHWAIHELPDGAWLIRLDQDGRQANLPSILIEAWQSPKKEGEKIARFDVWGYGNRSNLIQQIKGRYFVSDTSLEASIQVNNQAQRTYAFPIPEAVVVMPDIPFFWGLATKQMRLQGNHGTIFTCGTNFDDVDGFMPQVYPQTTQFLGKSVIEVLGKGIQVEIYQLGDALEVAISGNLGITIMTKNKKTGNNTHELVYVHRPMKGAYD